MSDRDSFGFEGMEDPISPDAPGTGIGVVKVGKRDYAIGLHWNGVEDPLNASKEARALASNPSFNADFFCVRHGVTPQFGLGFKTQGHRLGMPSLAAHIAQAKSGSWIALFEVKGGYYLIAVKEDGILSECDRFFESADDARSIFEYYQTSSDWGEAIAPKSFEIPGTQPGDLETLLEGKPAVQLQDVSKSSLLIKAGLAAAAIGGLIVGVMLYMDNLEEMKQMEFARQLAEEAANVISPKPEEPPPPPAPWEGRMIGSLVLVECVDQIKQFPLDIPGWEVNQLICERGHVAAAVDRDGSLGSGGGSFNWVKLMVDKDDFKPNVYYSAGGSGGRVSVEWKHADLPKIPLDLQTIPVRKMKDGVMHVLEERFVPVALGEAPDNNDYFRGFTFKFETELDIVNFGDLISALPGAIIDRIIYTVNTNTWTLEGRAYEQLQPQKKIN